MLFGREKQSVEEIGHITGNLTHDNAGNKLGEAVDLYSKLSREARIYSEPDMHIIRDFVRKAEVGWPLFTSPPNSSRLIDDSHYTQLVLMIETLHQVSYCFERLEEAAFFTGGSSTPVRFYLNSLYHYLGALFLIDKRNTDLIGGSMYKCLHPLGLDGLLDGVADLLNRRFSGKFTFGEVVRQIRNKFLVHSNFSPKDLEKMVTETRFRTQNQMLLFTDMMWLLFHEVLLIKLKLISVLTSTGRLPDKVLLDYLATTN